MITINLHYVSQWLVLLMLLLVGFGMFSAATEDKSRRTPKVVVAMIMFALTAMIFILAGSFSMILPSM